jgi:hypothetical protein
MITVPGTRYRFVLQEHQAAAAAATAAGAGGGRQQQRRRWSTTRRFRTVAGSVNAPHPPVRRGSTGSGSGSGSGGGAAAAGQDDRPIRFVVGGDSGSTTASRLMMRAAASRSPDFAVHGGDLAYANALSSCCRLWDQFLTDWETLMVTPDGCMIPLLSLIGNHDAGSNHNAGLFSVPDGGGGSGEEAGDAAAAAAAAAELLPPMLRYFPHEVPLRAPTQRRSYHKHTAAGSALTIVGLDSGYVAPVDGAQQAWLAEALQPPTTTAAAPTADEDEDEDDSHQGDEKNKSRWQFAVYHVPLYASTGHWEDDDQQAENVKARRAWVPTFDAVGLDAAFEHHVHTMKRTRPMRGSVYHPQGTTYLGACLPACLPARLPAYAN